MKKIKIKNKINGDEMKERIKIEIKVVGWSAIELIAYAHLKFYYVIFGWGWRGGWEKGKKGWREKWKRSWEDLGLGLLKTSRDPSRPQVSRG